MKGRLGRGVLLLAALVLGIVLWPAAASAHATVVGTSPADGAHLDAGPVSVTFTLNEAVSVVGGSAQVIDRDGARYPVAGTELSADRTVVTVRLVRALPDGSFLATARLLSADTHVVSVSAAFTVGAAEGLLTAPAASGPGFPAYAAKLLVYLGAVLSAGVALTTRWVWPHLRSRGRWRTLVRVGAVLLAAGLAARLVQLPELVTSAFGVTTVAALGAAAVLIARPGWWGAAVPVIVAVTYGGHGTDRALLLTGLHVYAVLAWLGGVAVIAVELRRDGVTPPPHHHTAQPHRDSATPPPDHHTAEPHRGGATPPPDHHTAEPRRGGVTPLWHRYALGHAGMAVVTGGGLALLRVPAPEALLSTAYGRILILKLVLVGLVLGTAGLVHRRLTRLVRAELLLAVSVFGATGVLSSVAPANVSYDPQVRTTVNFGGGSVLDVTIPSTRRGPQRLIVESAAGVTPTVDLSSRDANVARLPVRFGDAENTGDGVRWASRDLVVPVAGNWQVTITFGTPAGPRVASFRYDVR